MVITYYDKINENNQVVPQSAYYNYNGYGLLDNVTNIDGLKVAYSYTATVPHRVTRVEISNNGTYFGGRKYEYKDCLTVVTDLVVSNNVLVDGKKLFYHFNDNGNVVSVNDELGYGCFAKYTDDMPTNHPEVLSRMQRSVVNLLKNHNFETSTNWTNQTWNGATGSYANSTAYYYMGAKSLAMTRTNSSGQLTSYQVVNITKGKTYTFSAYYRTTNAAKAQLEVDYMSAVGGEVPAQSQEMQSTDGWDRLAVTFEVPANSTSSSVTVKLMATTDTGVVYYDCAQLEEGAVANPYNMLENGDFTFNVNGKPQAWTELSTNTADTMVYDTPTGNKPQGLSSNTMRIIGGGRTVYPGIYQDVKVSGNKDDVFSVGGWSFNYSKPRKGEDYRYNIRVQFLKAGTSSTYSDAPSIEWSEEWTDWQFAAGPVIAPVNYSAIRFRIDYQRNINYAEFGGLFLYKEEFGKTFAYDENENITSVKNLASQQSHATYDDYNNLLTYRQPGRDTNEKYSLDWGSTTAEKKKHLLLKTTSPLSIIQENTYDEKGNVLTSKTRNSASTLVIQGSTAYTTNKNYVASQTDARGYTVNSNYDTTIGTLSSVTNPNGQQTTYTYDLMKRTTQTQSTVNNKTYISENTYSQDKLVKTAHNTDSDNAVSVEYNFGYDAMGRPTTVQVGNQTLSTTQYNNDGTVSMVVYGNDTSSAGQRVRYSYDEFKRLKGVQFSHVYNDVYKYDYGANGQVGRLTDTILNREYVSEYDTANRPMRIIQKENGAHMYTGQVEYDEYNNLKTFKEKVGTNSTAYQTDFTYDIENKPTKLTYGNANNKIEYTYDGIGRMSQRAVTLGGATHTTTYGYVAGNNGTGNTTGMLSRITHPDIQYLYSYDNMGNITAWTQFDSTVTYVYDAMGQLIRVNDPMDPRGNTNDSTGTTWTFEYDRGGNILNKKRYEYTTGTLGTPQQTINYGYDTTWKDKLISYNGATISYDAIGNPTSDGTWSYVWENGRQLKQMYKSDTTVNFAYNHDGLRVRKTVNNVVTDYTLHGKNIVHLKQGNNNLHFFYDASGKPAVVDYNGTKYAYQHNLQGDIMEIVDASGNVVVEYNYDAWGAVLSTTGSMASTLGTIQPFRYRGYVYDVESGYYYLISRYYNPQIARFLESDCIISHELLANNQWCYCENNPIKYADQDGFDPSDAVSTKVPASYIIEGVCSLEKKNETRYVHGASNAKRSDCIGLILQFVYEFLGDSIISNKYVMINDQKVTIGKSTKDAIEYNVNNKKKGLKPIPEDSSSLYDMLPGTLVFTDDLKHIGIYVGYYVDRNNQVIDHCVIDCTKRRAIKKEDRKNGVYAYDINNSRFTQYCTFNYIDYDLTYGDTVNFYCPR